MFYFFLMICLLIYEIIFRFHAFHAGSKRAYKWLVEYRDKDQRDEPEIIAQKTVPLFFCLINFDFQANHG